MRSRARQQTPLARFLKFERKIKPCPESENMNTRSHGIKTYGSSKVLDYTHVSNVPPDVVERLLRQIMNQFVQDSSRPEAIVVGLNVVREMCLRMPL
ncbi:hypothetical protein HPP92_028035, partial [Vanilla planifolia]